MHRAVVRPDPYGLPGWITNSDLLAARLVDLFGNDFKAMIELSQKHGVETGVFLCYDAENDTMKLGPMAWGKQQIVVIRDCIGYRPIGSFHVHLGLRRRALYFSPPDISGGLHEFALAVGGEQYEMAVLSPYNYWKLPDERKDEVDYHLNSAMKLILLANLIYEEKPENWSDKMWQLDDEANAHMDAVYELLKTVYVSL